MKIYLHLFGLSYLLFIYTLPVFADLPCYGCTRYYGDKRRSLKRQTNLNDECDKPCPRCPLQQCQEGVSLVLDGCGCCYMCARQHGDLCSRKDNCDTYKGLRCDIPRRMDKGLCRSNNPQPCIVNGKIYRDGDQFHLDCRRLCTCQNGNYGCADLCPQEYKPPAAEYCKNAKLVPVPGQCCHQWTCNGLNFTNKSPRHAQWETPRASFMISKPQKDVQHAEPECREGGTDWSACSVTCGSGISYRYEPNSCGKVKETRICFTRPCTDKPLESPEKKRRCSPTTRSKEKRHILHKEGETECRSVKKYRMKFCTSCSKNKCCHPYRTQTRNLEFYCGSHYKYFQYAWIKRCKCSRQCKGSDVNKEQ